MEQTTLFDSPPIITPTTFGGETFDAELDGKRLAKQSQAVFDLMKDGHWRTLYEIAERIGIPEQSASARLRDFRKEKFGGHRVERKRGGNVGTWAYRLIVAKNLLTTGE